MEASGPRPVPAFVEVLTHVVGERVAPESPFHGDRGLLVEADPGLGVVVVALTHLEPGPLVLGFTLGGTSARGVGVG